MEDMKKHSVLPVGANSYFPPHPMKKTTKSIAKVKDSTKDSLATKFWTDYTSGYESIATVRDTWEEKEAMMMGHTIDSITKSETKSKVFDPRLSTISFERMMRVTAQMASGKIQALTKQNKGKSVFMNLIHQNYVIPNANTQYDILTKFRLLDFYSFVYGSMFALVDYMVTDTYVGPDFHILPIRNVVPQAGKYNLNDSDYVFVKYRVSKEWLLKQRVGTWKNIDKLIDVEGSSSDDDDTHNETRYSGQRKDKLYDIYTKYERDRWVTVSKDGKYTLRDIANKQMEGELPVVEKHAFPLLDRFFGLGEFEKGRTLQLATNSLINLYLDGVKMSIYPPYKVYLPDIVAQTLDQRPGAMWVLKNNNPNAISQVSISPQGINSFQSTYQFLIASMMNQAGTTDTSVSREADISQGKTPQALKQMAMREGARDNFDRFLIEKTIEKIYDRFINLIATKQEKPIKLQLLAKELEQVSEIYPDAVEMFETNEMGEVVIDPKEIKDVKYKYFIDAGSTMKKDETIENETLTNLIALILKIPGAIEQAKQTGKVVFGDKVVEFAELLKRYIMTSGIQDSDKLITDVKNDAGALPGIEQDSEMQSMMGMQSGQPPQPQMGGMPPEAMMQGQPMQQPMAQPMPQQAPMPVDTNGLSPESLQVINDLQNYVRTNSQR